MRNAPVQTLHGMLLFIDVAVKSILMQTVEYKGKVQYGPFDSIRIPDEKTARRFHEDYLQLTSLYVVKYEDKLRALGFKDQ